MEGKSKATEKLESWSRVHRKTKQIKQNNLDSFSGSWFRREVVLVPKKGGKLPWVEIQTGMAVETMALMNCKISVGL